MPRKIKEREYHVIGWLLMQIDPTKAREIISVYVKPTPKYNDFSLIPSFFYAFCEIWGIDPEKFRGTLFKTSMVDTRRLFVSTMIRLYNPQLYNHPPDCILIRRGFNKKLADFLGLDYGTMSKTIRDCMTQEKIYQNIKDQVSSLVVQIESAALN